MTPGEQLRRWRVARSLGQRAAAAQAGVCGATWSHAETGTPVTPETAALISALTGVRVASAVKQLRAAPAVGRAGKALLAWRVANHLTEEAAAKRIGCSKSPLCVLEKGGHVTPATAELIRAATGIDVPAANRRTEASFKSAIAPKPSRYCDDCCGLPHRRPISKLCRCGESWAPDVVEIASGLRSASDWMGEPAEEAAE